MAFRTFIYLDEAKLYEYLAAFSKQSVLSGSKRTIKGRVNAGVAELEGGIELSPSSNERPSPAVAYDLFEKELDVHGGDDYFDLLSGDCDISTLPPLSIFRCSGYVEIPESFDTLAVISEYLQPLKAAGVIPLDGDPATNEFVLSFFERTDADVPILISGNDIVISSKLKPNLFVDASYQVLEDMEDEEVFALCKVHSYLKKDKVVVFDPAKDFLKLNRAFRRSMTTTEGLDPIMEPGPILKAEIIAIYH